MGFTGESQGEEVGRSCRPTPSIPLPVISARGKVIESMTNKELLQTQEIIIDPSAKKVNCVCMNNLCKDRMHA